MYPREVKYRWWSKTECGQIKTCMCERGATARSAHGSALGTSMQLWPMHLPPGPPHSLEGKVCETAAAEKYDFILSSFASTSRY